MGKKLIISHDLADSRWLRLVLLEEVVQGVETELLRHEKLKLKAEIHIVVDLLQLAVLPQHVAELLRGELGLHELLNFDEAQFFLGFLKLVLYVGKGL